MRCDRKINSLNPDLRETFSPLMFRSIIFCATLFLLAINGLSQSDSTMVRFFVKGGDQYRVRIDDELMPKTNKFRVAKGSHKVEIWSFKHDIHKGTLETGNLDSTNYFADLKVSASYNSYLAKRDDYKRKVFFYKTAPILLSGVSLIALPVTFYGMKEKHEELTQNEFYLWVVARMEVVIITIRIQLSVGVIALFLLIFMFLGVHLQLSL